MTWAEAAYQTFLPQEFSSAENFISYDLGNMHLPMEKQNPVVNGVA